jgi:hypothetical protein
MQELRAQIQAQLKLADTLKKLGDHAGNECKWVKVGKSNNILYFRQEWSSS